MQTLQLKSALVNLMYFLIETDTNRLTTYSNPNPDPRTIDHLYNTRRPSQGPCPLTTYNTDPDSNGKQYSVVYTTLWCVKVNFNRNCLK